MAPITTDAYLQAVKFRRTVYPLTNKSPVSDARIEEIVQGVIGSSPSSYNTQSTRVLVLLGAQHEKLWDLVREHALPLLQGAGEDVVKSMEGRFSMFRAAYGSVLFFENKATVDEAAKTHAAVAGMFPQWSEHASAMAQVQLWTALELEGLGANLQHMNAFPPVAAAIRKQWDLPEAWILTAHLNFGTVNGEFPEHPKKLPFSETVKVAK
ncbi:Nitroreductase [Pseudovirgaria hyperparasitica]|uniref:Nitroreductase n=1 Tax=Pseudovirgaria hyperparasitica TaxID=470096 RepID=A0A6A6W3C3_9PEZI|nr:Nitroreductase [Pseudovirgaria hyperparasitica]KAF2756430.1 Nitroreductase [Pseudovirgaria hyperparasitica]